MRSAAPLARRLVAAAGLLGFVVAPTHAQDVSAESGVLFERYTFGAGVAVRALHQLAVPVVVEAPVRGALVTVATGWTRVEMERSTGEAATLTGVVDTEARVTLPLRADRVRLFATAAVPTGIGALGQGEFAVVGPLAHDLLGFSTPTVGSGGSIGVGIAGATPLGAATAVGWAAHVRVPFSYAPVLGSPDRVRAGNELRVRLGLETAVGDHSALRVAAVASVRGADRLRGDPSHAVGRRVAGHAAFATPVAGALTTLWVSGFYRGEPSVEPTAVGASIVPRGGLLAAGVRARVGVGGESWLEPEVEFRTSAIAPDGGGGELLTEGHIARAGVRLLRPLAASLGLAAEAGGRWGTLQDGPRSATVRGLRASLALRWSR